MKAKMMVVVGALAGLAFVGCNDHKNAPTATGNPVTAQAGTVEGRITDIDSQTFTVQVPGGEEVTLHRGAQAGSLNLQKGQDVHASYQVDTDGNKIAQNVSPISPNQLGANAGGQSPANSDKQMTAQAEQIQGRITDVDDNSFTVQVPGGNKLTLEKTAQAASQNLQKGQDVRATYRLDSSGNRIAESVQLLSSGAPDTNR